LKWQEPVSQTQFFCLGKPASEKSRNLLSAIGFSYIYSSFQSILSVLHMLDFLTVTTIISSLETDNHNFQALKEYLRDQAIYLNTTPKEELPEGSKSAMVTIIAYTSQTTTLEIRAEDEIISQLASIFNKPTSLRLSLEGQSIISAQVFADNQIILLKLDKDAQEFRPNLPHHFFDLAEGITNHAANIARIIRSAGIRDTTPKSNRPNRDDLARRFSMAKLNNDDFPLLDDGTKILPGTKIYGGSGFYYDTNGYILDARKVANTGRLNEDWVFLCGFEAYEFNDWVEVEGRYEWFYISEFATSLLTDLLPPQPLLIQGKSLIKSVDLEVMEYCAKHPEGFDHLTPEAFEDLIAAMYRNYGFDVEKVGRWNQADGGVDILAIRKDMILGEYKVAVQCKHSGNKIRPAVIRELNGTIDQFKANAGVVATTSSFSAQSYELVENNLWRISLQDRNYIIERLKDIFKK